MSKPTPEKAREYNHRAWLKRKANPVRIATWRVAQNQRARERRVKCAADPSLWLSKHLNFLRYSAKKRGIAFSLTVEDLETPRVCPITGWAIQYDNRSIQRDSPSVDRKIPMLGYVPGNVRIISQWANTLRGNCLQPWVFEALAKDAAAVREEFGLDG